MGDGGERHALGAQIAADHQAACVGNQCGTGDWRHAMC